MSASLQVRRPVAERLPRSVGPGCGCRFARECALAAAPPCSWNSVSSSWLPRRLARRRPPCRSHAVDERAHGQPHPAASVPDQRGALRVPDNVALASSVPRTRQPGVPGQTTHPIRAGGRTPWPASAGQGRRFRPTAGGCWRWRQSRQRVRWPCRRAFRVSASSCTLSSACRRPAGCPAGGSGGCWRDGGHAAGPSPGRC